MPEGFIDLSDATEAEGITLSFDDPRPLFFISDYCDDPRDVDTFMNFASNLVKQHGGQVIDWQIVPMGTTDNGRGVQTPRVLWVLSYLSESAISDQ